MVVVVMVIMMIVISEVRKEIKVFILTLKKERNMKNRKRYKSKMKNC